VPDQRFDNEAVPVDGLKKLVAEADRITADRAGAARQDRNVRARLARDGAYPEAQEGYYRMSLGNYEQANKAARAGANFRAGTRKAPRR